MTNLVQLVVAGDVAEAEQLQEMLERAGIAATLETAVEHDPDVADDPPVKLLVADADVDAARDAIEALTEPDELVDE